MSKRSRLDDATNHQETAHVAVAEVETPPKMSKRSRLDDATNHLETAHVAVAEVETAECQWVLQQQETQTSNNTEQGRSDPPRGNPPSRTSDPPGSMEEDDYEDDAHEANNERIDYAGPKDCLAGRGGYTNTHEGTIAYRAFVDERFCDLRWYAANNTRKQQIRDERIHSWRAQGGRFLRGNIFDGFFPMTEKRILAKTGQRLRENQTDAGVLKFFDNFFPEEPAHYSEQNLSLMQAAVGDFKPVIDPSAADLSASACFPILEAEGSENQNAVP